MPKLDEQANENHGYSGFLFAAFLAIFFCSIVFLAIPPVGVALFLFWTLPSLIHAWANIARHSRYVPLPWEDQFAAVIVACILQIPLWLTAGFMGFLLGALVCDLLIHALAGASALPVGSYIVVWIAVTIPVYVVLFITTVLWTTFGLYCDDSESNRISIRDAKPIYHPF
ncbi:hypothetical protein Pan97_42860 [Bremerella volcania]|uniref:Uncharacterized protein n=1 Tax=Bremerella volcania TaxID=2527984 RepID=A0A518CDF1_9BACT|nr:hypothetical protein [Bremerella volcania]QDU77224.1 hypothetical protein Pan97_42860 [Bremerella volcania]